MKLTVEVPDGKYCKECKFLVKDYELFESYCNYYSNPDYLKFGSEGVEKCQKCLEASTVDESYDKMVTQVFDKIFKDPFNGGNK